MSNCVEELMLSLNQHWKFGTARRHFLISIIIPLQQIDDENGFASRRNCQTTHSSTHYWRNIWGCSPFDFSMPPFDTAGNCVHDRFRFLANCVLDESAISRMWKQPTRLGCTTRRKFHAAQVLRSSQVNLEFLYRLVQQIDEPWRTRAQRSLKDCLEFKGGCAPPANVPMLLLPLQCDVKGLVRTWLQELLQHHSCLFPSFHAPTMHVVLRRSRPFSDFVFNFYSFLRNWSPDECMFECVAYGTSDYGDDIWT